MADRDSMMKALRQAKLRIERSPGTRFAIEMHGALSQFEAAFADGREPDQDELRSLLELLIVPLERKLEEEK